MFIIFLWWDVQEGPSCLCYVAEKFILLSFALKAAAASTLVPRSRQPV